MLELFYVTVSQPTNLIPIIALIVSVLSALFAAYKVYSDRSILKAEPIDLDDQKYIWLNQFTEEIKIEVHNIGHRITKVNEIQVYFKTLSPSGELTRARSNQLFRRAGYIRDANKVKFDILPGMKQILTFTNSAYNTDGSVSQIFSYQDLPGLRDILVIEIDYKFYISIFYYALAADNQKEGSKLFLVASNEKGWFGKHFSRNRDYEENQD